MRKLYPEEIKKASEYFDRDRVECRACPYPAIVNKISSHKRVCGLVYYDCVVSRPVCLE